MGRITELGNKIVAAQTALGLPNPEHLNQGLTSRELARLPLLLDVPSPSELHELFTWKNGAACGPGIPMGRLWIMPGYFLLSAERAFVEHEYCTGHINEWRHSWYPLLSGGSADILFFDTTTIVEGRVPIFHSFPESAQSTGRIYDNLEAMFATILHCYEEGAYFLDSQGWLDSNFKHEVEIARKLNPASDYWQRPDLF